MNYQETKQKVLKLCDKLNKEGLLTEGELENCRRSFTFEGQNLDLELYKFAKTSKEYSFGMSENQGSDDLIRTDLTKVKYIKCFLSTSDKKKYLATRPGMPGELYMAPSEIINTTSNTNELDYVMFIIELQTTGKYAGTYTLMNAKTGNYLSINQDKTVSIANNTITDDCYFKLVQGGPNQYLYTFEAVKYQGRYLIADTPVRVGNTGLKYWYIERINPNVVDNVVDVNDPKFDETATLIDNLLKKINDSKLNYYVILAQIEFLTLMKNKMYNLVKSQGDIMNYYFDKKDNRELNISEDLLKYIQFSINNELRSHEGSQIDDLIDKLTVEGAKIKGTEYEFANNKALKLQQLIASQINEKKKQISNLSQMIDSISARQRDLNQQQQTIETRESIIKNKKSIVDKNYGLVMVNDNDYKMDLYFAIVTGVILIGLIIFFGYKLWQRFSTEILNT